MNTKTQPSTGFAWNQISIEALFEKYAEVGFLYPAKMKLLRPHFGRIKQNWRRMLCSKDNLLWILTNRDQANFASIAVLKHSNHGLIAQHLVSDGNPRLSLQLMAQAQRTTESISEQEAIHSSQNWFRPNNRYAYRIFGSMYDKLGSDKASLLTFDYLKQPLANIANTPLQYRAEVVETADADLVRFVSQRYNAVFCQAEELAEADVNFTQLSKAYARAGLKKGRKIIKLIDPISQETLACAIANRAPIGLNFSFLENRAYYIIDQSLPASTRSKLARELSQHLRSYYQDFDLQAIPIVTDEATTPLLQNQGAEFLRTYMQSIWLQSGFAQWRAHIESFLERIERRRSRA